MNPGALFCARVQSGWSPGRSCWARCWCAGARTSAGFPSWSFAAVKKGSGRLHYFCIHEASRATAPQERAQLRASWYRVKFLAKSNAIKENKSEQTKLCVVMCANAKAGYLSASTRHSSFPVLTQRSPPWTRNGRMRLFGVCTLFFFLVWSEVNWLLQAIIAFWHTWCWLFSCPHATNWLDACRDILS